MKNRKWILAVLGAVFFLTGISPEGGGAADLTLTIQSAFQKGEQPVELLKVFAAEAGKKREDELKIKVVPTPHVVPLELLLKATARGGVDMMQGPGILWRDEIPQAVAEFGLPLAYKIEGETNVERQAQLLRDFLFNSGSINLLRETYAKHGLYLLDFHTYGPTSYMLSTEPFKTLADMRDKRVRTGGLMTILIEGLGLKAVPIPASKTFQALKQARVDAAQGDINEILDWKWYETAPYWVKGLENDHGIGHILLKLQKWESLSPRRKEALQRAGAAYWHATVKAAKDKVDFMNNLIHEGKLVAVRMDEETQNVVTMAAYKMWDSAAETDSAMVGLVRMLKKWHGLE